MTRILVVRGEARRVSALGNFTTSSHFLNIKVNDLRSSGPFRYLESVDSVATVVQSVHEIH